MRNQKQSARLIIVSLVCAMLCLLSNARLHAESHEKQLESGQKLFRQRCVACHVMAEGKRHRIGPNLWGAAGCKIGSKPDYGYSKVLKQSELTLDQTTLDDWLANPRKFLPGNRMSFVGIKKQEQRDALIAWLFAHQAPCSEKK